MNCYAHGGGVHQPSYSHGNDLGASESGDQVRDASRMKRGSPKMREAKLESARSEHREKLGELKSMPAPKLKGLAEGGVAGEDGEPMDDMAGVDDELMDMACGELLDAIESKNKKEILESLKAIILSCKG